MFSWLRIAARALGLALLRFASKFHVVGVVVLHDAGDTVTAVGEFPTDFVLEQGETASSALIAVATRLQPLSKSDPASPATEDAKLLARRPGGLISFGPPSSSPF